MSCKRCGLIFLKAMVTPREIYWKILLLIALTLAVNIYQYKDIIKPFTRERKHLVEEHFDGRSTSKSMNAKLPVVCKTQSSFLKGIDKEHRVYNREKSAKKVLFWFIPRGDVTMPLEIVKENINFSIYEKDLQTDGFLLDSPICGKCHFTFDTTKHSVSDAVVFNSVDIHKERMPPDKIRKYDQYYVWLQMDTLAQIEMLDANFLNRTVINEYFNLTMGVKRSSDVYSPFANLAWILKLIWYKNKGKDLIKRLAHVKAKVAGIPVTRYGMRKVLANLPEESLTKKYAIIPTKYTFEITRLLQRKNRMAVWVSSNCAAAEVAPIIRLAYIDQLQKLGLKLDKLGECGTINPVKSRWDPAFFEMISRYKFYFAMEDSYHCKDYTSEKLWYNALYSGAVPIIFGPDRRDIVEVLPPKSYIHVEDYPNPKTLLEHLEHLNENVEDYAAYLHWRTWTKHLDENGNYFPYQKRIVKLGGVRFLYVDRTTERQNLNKFCSVKPTGLCALCKRLYDVEAKSHVVNDLAGWLHDEREECTNRTLAKKLFRFLS